MAALGNLHPSLSTGVSFMTAIAPAIGGTEVPPPSAGDKAERVMLSGPHSRLRELWLVLGTVADFLRGFRALHFVGPCVTVFGSARFGSEHPYYELTRTVGRRLSRMGFTVMTGGGPGLMEAANRGAKDVDGASVGCNIRLPVEQHPNPYLDRWITCQHLFVRKVMLFKYSYAFVAMPGGMGTVDELFEALTLIQTGKIEPFPVVLIGSEYWKPLRGFLDEMVATRAIDAPDLRLMLITDDLEEMARHLERGAIQRFRLHEAARPKARRWLGERAVTT
jgi:uncharacterized protein (TIGR00730 family)